jgi:hypothetical protein
MGAKKRRLLSPLLLWFMGTMILANIAAMMIFPLESLYVQELGASVEQVGLFFTSLGLISLPAPWIGARLWEGVSPIFPFYVPLVAMVAMLPVMWIKFRLPPERGEGTEEDASAAAEAAAEASTTAS